MNRKDFIKQSTGGAAGLKRAMLWSAVIVVILLFFKADLGFNFYPDKIPSSGLTEEDGSFSLIQFLKAAGIIIAIVTGMLLLAMLLNFLEQKIAAIIPGRVKSWHTKHKKLINILANAFIILGFACYCIMRGYYVYLAAGLLYTVFYFLRSQAEKKTNTNQPV